MGFANHNGNAVDCIGWMMNMRELIQDWRAQAELSDWDSAVARALRMCADELEEAWHDHAHDGAWESDGSCQICLQEISDLEPVKPVGYSDVLPG